MEIMNRIRAWWDTVDDYKLHTYAQYLVIILAVETTALYILTILGYYS